MKLKIACVYVTLLSVFFLSACGNNIPVSLDTSALPDTTVSSAPESAKDTEAPSSTEVINPPTTESPQLVIGDRVRFGGYDWIILDIRDGKALLLTEEIVALKYGNISSDAVTALDALADEYMEFWEPADFEEYSTFNTKYDGIYDAYTAYVAEHPGTFDDNMWNTSWDKCSLREWLNSEMDFTVDEWALIETTTVIDATGLGGNTEDKVFLLDRSDVERYFPRNESRGASCAVSDEEMLGYLQYTLLQGSLSGNVAARALESLNGGNFYWWVRGATESKYFLQPMSTDEYLGAMAASLKKPLGVRPALWIYIDNL